MGLILAATRVAVAAAMLVVMTLGPAMVSPAQVRLVGQGAPDEPLVSVPITATVVGDLCGDDCDLTAAVVADIDPDLVLTTGDNAYVHGTLAEFQSSYHPHWGQFADRVRPTPGNHEYHMSAAQGYFDYFNGVGANGGPAGSRGAGYYSFDRGNWHFVALNSAIARDVGSEQLRWLREDLAASSKACTVVYQHHPRFSSGEHGDDLGSAAVFNLLYEHNVELFVAAHDHNYERFAPADPDGTAAGDGVRQFVIGTGGRSLYSKSAPSDGPSEVFHDRTYGVGKLTLGMTGYEVEFVPVAGGTFTDHVRGKCDP